MRPRDLNRRLRVRETERVASDYAEAMKQAAAFPAAVVFRDAGEGTGSRTARIASGRTS